MSAQAFIDELRWRGLLTQVSDEAGLLEHLDGGRRTLYCGFDPTADSLHIGSLVPLLALRRFQLQGHRPLLLLGGATGLIGDPSGRDDERSLNREDTVGAWVDALRDQVSSFLDFETADGSAAKIVNNLDWTSDLSVIDFLRDIGKHFSVNAMIQRESVKARLERAEQGISYTEFSYMLLQAMDFLRLAQNEGCSVQIGGSDQWGNIVSGIDLIRRHMGETAYAFTMPLVTKADGTKFGKTEGGNIWLDKNRTSPYKFYQYWLNASDADAENYIKIFTFLSREEIDALIEEHKETPHLRLLQKRIAEEVTVLVHSKEDLANAQRASQILFGKSTSEDLKQLDNATFLDVFDGVPQAQMEKAALADGVEIISALAGEGKLLNSNGEARRAFKENSISVNKTKVSDQKKITAADLINDRYVLLQRGKKSYFILEFV